MKKLLILVFLLIANQNFAQLKTHTFEEAEKLSIENPKPFVVFIHTSWCKYCKMMQNSTFKNEEVIKQLNETFYFISFDAEAKNDITFNNHIFKFKPKGNNSGIHELAESLSNQTYPTITILNPNYDILVQIESMTNAQYLLQILEKIN
ncbi:thioredoxin-related protein [Flavobacterium arsenatis]|uniref:Thioredoxin-related protein n=1 Tax=Flavobacterium arsenatis TaxID=1484332 RepID=A0ABU1TT53_9FLAO|nr:thioredoxin fold domain-containing protein [Flavobacterium arsenatis]MDR6969058.1 thioredoxin-related protein [Flavobacterium arsenatis]